jgi:hypothetical protein
VFLAALHTIRCSDRKADRWREDHAGAEGLTLHHLYRAMAWPSEELPEQEQEAAPFAPRCLKGVVEEQLSRIAATCSRGSISSSRTPRARLRGRRRPTPASKHTVVPDYAPISVDATAKQSDCGRPDKQTSL